MAKLILITGQLAALKSTVARQLEKTLNIPCYIKDEIKEILGDAIGFSNREENLKLSLATFRIMIHLADHALSHDQDIILESNFKKEELDLMKTELNLAGHEVISIFMTGDPNVLYERYVKRNDQRHPVHQSTGVLSETVFKKIMDERHEDDLFGRIIRIDTTSFDQKDFRNLVEQIRG